MATSIAATQSLDKLRSALVTDFPADKVDEIIFYFNMLRKEARLDHWDSCLINSGKFVEAVLKCFHYLQTGVEIALVSVDEEVKQLEQNIKLSDSDRLIISGVLGLIYEFCNKRGGVYNTSFGPIKVDCVLVVALSKWVMEELTRLYLINDAIAAQMLVESLLVKELPLVEELEGDRLILTPGLSARVQLEILLWKEHPKRCSIKDLARWAHNHSIENIRVTLRTMKQKNLAHETEEGWLLTASGLKEAEMEITSLLNTTVSANAASKGKTKGAKRGRK